MSDPAAPAPLRIAEPGIYDLTEKQYHADPVIVPSFSRSIAKLFVELSPAHARAAHPRFGGDGAILEDDAEHEAEQRDTQEDRDVGSVAHAMFLRGEKIAELVPFNTYQTKEAKRLRDEILAAGKIPLKVTKHDETMRLVDALEAYRARTGAFTKGKPEQTLIWREGETWCRCMVDWLPDDAGAPLQDLKTTAGRAVPAVWTRRCFSTFAHLQTVFYPRGAAEVRDGEVPAGMHYHVAETKPPFGIRKFELTDAATEVAAAQLEYALAQWRWCMKEASWPGYDEGTVEWVDPPVYVLREWDWRTRTGSGLGHRPPSPLLVDHNGNLT